MSTTTTTPLPLLLLIILSIVVSSIDRGMAEESSSSSSPLTKAASTQQSPNHLAEKALSESLARVASTKSFLNDLLTKFKGLKKKSAEREVIGDCLDFMDDSKYEIIQSIQELKKYMTAGSGKTTSQEEFWDHMSNVKTWVSAVLANQDTCLDGFVDLSLNGTAIEASVKPRVAYVEQTIDNALAFITQFADDYSASTNFVTASCTATCYPLLCLESLLATDSIALVRSPRQLAKSALVVSLASAESTKASVKKMMMMENKFKGIEEAAEEEYEAMEKDCLDHIDDCVYRLSQAVHELNQIKRSEEEDFLRRISSLQNLVSAAIIDGNKCMDDLKKFKSHSSSSRRIKASTLGQVTNLVKVTKNGLALVNQFAIKN